MPLGDHILGKVVAKKMGAKTGTKTGCGGKPYGWSMGKFTAGKGHVGDSVTYTAPKYTITIKGDVTTSSATGSLTGKFCF